MSVLVSGRFLRQSLTQLLVPRQHFAPRVAREIRKNARIIQKTSDFSEQLAINRPKMTENVLKMRVGLAARVLVQNETLKCEQKWRAKSLKTTGAQGFFLHSLIDV